eukprot:CAMPEP_0119106700 /NCGR_PEP_ID=MMETSP1180-20130426/6187_1 /TAXON_ID=3052 ORGANISM="Chlamydomonas cf sp, Strain CCMP681" /NCGR_SAMPLE_ID=MMETSP1180 /ASSEMBLY_ACC=CAM_ASM_000741 /LENGTH=225 /DNA_ID=CAMNT_0007092079 /DNA_START=12 /DNA_END=689 /DNA_ORIENTATION=+
MALAQRILTPAVQVARPVPACSRISKRSAVVVHASIASGAADASRRQVLSMGVIGVAAVLAPQAAFAASGKAPGGFNAYEDTLDNYKFVYPFGWQEVSVSNTDIVFKDIVEPLESVSMTKTVTDKNDITEFGDIKEVAETLVNKVLTVPTQEVKLISTNQRELNGHNYYEFEFTVKAGNYNRHQLAVVAASKGTFYTLTTGANERRWDKMKDRLQTTIRSFMLII